jgi:hypothetical protein
LKAYLIVDRELVRACYIVDNNKWRGSFPTRTTQVTSHAGSHEKGSPAMNLV